MKNYSLGIDTSNYTTSVALVDEQKNLLYDNRKMLIVKQGQKGLRQSDAFFQHVLNIPNLFEDLSPLFSEGNIKVISVSSKPRPVEGSYMPVFKVAQCFGKTMAHMLGCKYMEFSHQEGHIEAGKWSIEEFLKNEFIAVHLSGGTTEILHVKQHPYFGYQIRILGGTLDISAGQFIDRIGIQLGYPFPAGKFMDDMIANEMNTISILPVFTRDTYMSFSGPETKAYQLIEQGYNKNAIARGVFQCIIDSLKKSLTCVCNNTELNQVLFIGGVASSKYIQKHLSEALLKENIFSYFGKSKYCIDNAVGIALLSLQE